MHQSELVQKDILEYLAQHERKELLRFITCGSVDDGKSTLIGRLLHDTKLIYEDQLNAIKKDSEKHGTTGTGEIDLALLVDGLAAEREQGITIDVAYRYFSTDKRKFIIADTPGHEQYTRNMATGASTCDLAVILVDARHGVMTQTKRHSFIVALLGIKHVVVAINKMDLVDFSEEVYEKIKADYAAFSAKLNINDIRFIPMSALKGDNVAERSEHTPWYEGPTLLSFLENVYIASDYNFEDFRFPVQYVNRPNLDFRGFAGTIASGIIKKGDVIRALPSGVETRVKSILTMDGELEEAFPPLAVTITTETEIDISRGEMIVKPDNEPQVDRRFEAMIVWMSKDPMVPGNQYLIKQTTNVLSGSIPSIRYGVDVNTLETQELNRLELNQVGRCEVNLSRAICFDAYSRNRSTGAFVIIDRLTNVTVGAGMIVDSHRNSESKNFWDTPANESLSHKSSAVTLDEREHQLQQKAVTVLLTGLTGAGKSTIARELERRLFDSGQFATVLDGENMRLGISKDLGFTSTDRSENLRRSAEIAKLLNEAGLITIAAFVAPQRDVRNRARKTIGPDRFLEIHLDAPLEVCRERDHNGIYAKADSGEINDFPGISAPYEEPSNPDLKLNTAELTVEQSADRIIKLLEEREII